MFRYIVFLVLKKPVKSFFFFFKFLILLFFYLLSKNKKKNTEKVECKKKKKKSRNVRTWYKVSIKSSQLLLISLYLLINLLLLLLLNEVMISTMCFVTISKLILVMPMFSAFGNKLTFEKEVNKNVTFHNSVDSFNMKCGF